MSEKHELTPKRMTKREATRIMMEFAGRHIAGTGTGIGPERRPEDRELARAAARVLWPAVYGWPADDGSLSNMGFR